VAYATAADVYRLALPPGALQARRLEVAAVVGNSLRVAAHGLSADEIVVVASAGGAFPPVPLTTNARYYVRRVDEHHVELSLTAGGGAVVLSPPSSGRFALVPSLDATIEAHAETWSRWIDGKLVGHLVPLEEPYPAWVTYAVAVRSACSLLRSQGIGESAQRIFDLEAELLKDIPALVRGTPLRDAAATGPANLTQSSHYGLYTAPNRGLIR
jgi:hypothetical protein